MNEDLVYKYSDWNDYTKDTLEKRYFWFSKPTNFNDPFDSNVDILGAFNNSNNIFTQRKSPENSNETLLKYIKKKTENFGILCLTKPTEKGKLGDKGFNNLHFWSHYANSHKGISVGYETEGLENYYSEKLYCKALLSKVNYIKEPANIDTYDFIISKDDSGTITKRINGIFGAYRDDKNIDAFFEQILLFKDKRIWGIENEYRIILAGLALSNMKGMSLFSATDFEIIDTNGYRLPYPEGDIIKEITFGVNFNQNKLKDAIELISKKNKNVKFYTSKLDFINADIKREEIK